MAQNNRRNNFLILLVDLILFIAGGLIIITQAAFPTDWDACQFVLGMDRFCPPDHQPHPPGYLLFIVLGKIIKSIGGLSSHTALLVTSAIAAALLPPAVRRLTLKLYPGKHAVAIGTAMLAVGAPARLFYGAEALSYTWEGLFTTLVISLALDINSKSKKGFPYLWYAWVGLWAVATGFRPNLVMFFLPLAVYLAIRRKWWENLIGVAVFGLISAAWFIPTVIASGGYSIYMESLSSQSAHYLKFGLGCVINIKNLLGTPGAITGLHLIGWIIILAVFIICSWRRKIPLLSTVRHNRNVILLAAIPLLLFHIFIYYILDYSLTYVPILLPILALICARPVEWVSERMSAVPSSESKYTLLKLAWILPAVIMAFGYYGFLKGDANYSISHIRTDERKTRHAAEIVRGLGEPDTVTVIATDNFRRWGLELTEYTIWHPMRARYPKAMNPRLTAMKDGDTIAGGFFLPDAPDSENILIPLTTDNPFTIIVLDEKAYRVLQTPVDGWDSIELSGSENLYWQSFPMDILLVDTANGIELYGVAE